MAVSARTSSSARARPSAALSRFLGLRRTADVNRPRGARQSPYRSHAGGRARTPGRVLCSAQRAALRPARRDLGFADESGAVPRAPCPRAHRLAPGRPGARRAGSAEPLGWHYRRLTSRLRALPEFLIIGAQRCGTTSTYSYVVRAPAGPRGVAQGGPLLRLRRNYPHGEGVVPHALPARRPRDVLAGEATPEYMLRAAAAAWPRTCRGRGWSRCVRDPVRPHAVALSSRGAPRPESRPFEVALAGQAVERRRPRRAIDSYLVRGLYAAQLEAVLRCFPARAAPGDAERGAVRAPGPDVARIVDVPRPAPAPTSTCPPAQRRRYEVDAAPRSAPASSRFFRPHNARLYELLGATRPGAPIGSGGACVRRRQGVERARASKARRGAVTSDRGPASGRSRRASRATQPPDPPVVEGDPAPVVAAQLVRGEARMVHHVAPQPLQGLDRGVPQVGVRVVAEPPELREERRACGSSSGAAAGGTVASVRPSGRVKRCGVRGTARAERARRSCPSVWP